MAKSQPEITDRMTNCSVCFEPYEGKGDHVPRLLPCSHTFCERCIRDLLEEDVFHCPECKVPHPVENGAETFKPNKYVLSFMERIAADAVDIKEVTEQLLKKLDLVQDSLNKKKRNIEELKRKVIQTNKTCGENLQQKRQYLLKKINDTFDEMEKTIDSRTRSEIVTFDKDVEQTDKLNEHIQNLKEKIEKKTKGEQDKCAVELEQLKNIVEFPIKKYQHCEYHPEDFDSSFFTRICGYLSTEQLEYKETLSFGMEEMVRSVDHMCILSDTDEMCVIETLNMTSCWHEDYIHRLTKYSLQTGHRVEEPVQLNRIPNGIASVKVAEYNCVALSEYTYWDLARYSTISFRKVNNLRKTFCVYNAPVRLHSVWVASSLSLPSLLFYDEYYGGKHRPGILRSVDCRTKPPKAGETVIRIGNYDWDSLDVCFVEQGEKQMIVCFKPDGVSFHDIHTGEKYWQKRHAADISHTPGSMTTNSHSLILATHNHSRLPCIKMLLSDGRYMGKLMNISGPHFLEWFSKTSSLVVVHRKGRKNQEKWFVIIFKP